MELRKDGDFYRVWVGNKRLIDVNILRIHAGRFECSDGRIYEHKEFDTLDKCVKWLNG